MCTALLPPDVNPIAVNKYIISYSDMVVKFSRLKKGVSYDFYIPMLNPKCK